MSPRHVGSPELPVNDILSGEGREEGQWVLPDESVLGELSTGGESRVTAAVAEHSGTIRIAWGIPFASAAV